MKTKNLFAIIALCFFASFNSFGQERVLLEDHFDNALKGWLNKKSGKVTRKIKKGFYNQTNKDQGSYYYNALPVDLNADSSNFYMEADIIFKSGNKLGFYGLVFGANSSLTYYYRFAITESGVYKASLVSGGKEFSIKDQTYSSAIKRKGKNNKLAVKKTGNFLDFYINGVKVHRHIEYLTYYNKFGFSVGTSMSIAIDYVKVTSTPIIIKLVPNAVKGYKKENLGKKINTYTSELGPVISPDGNVLYFSRYPYKYNMGDTTRGDIYWSTLQSDGTFTQSKNISQPLNNSGSNFVIACFPDGNTLLVAHKYDEAGESAGRGLSLTQRTIDGWSVPKAINISFNNLSNYNEFAMSPDQKVIILAIQDEDSHGERDLYISFKGEDGNWSKPKNMGINVNSEGDEMYPFIAADNQTLYFASDGRPGYGNADLFVCTRLDDSWLNWSEPLNLGPEVNSNAWDASYTLSAKGDFAYIVSSKESYGKSDIFRIRVAESVKPKPTMLIKGIVRNSKNNEPIEASIRYYDLSTNKELGIANCDPRTGAYQIILPAGKKYGFLAEKNKFYSVSDNVDITVISEYSEITKDLYLAPIEEGQKIRLNNVFFETAKADLLPESYNELDRLIGILNSNPGLVIEISGHTDNVGNGDYNQKLSQNRAQSVYNYLVSKGISPDRLSFAGYGMDQPVASNETEEGKAMNRRVEFRIIKTE